MDITNQVIVGVPMVADDVTDSKPLNGGRQRANHIQVHRIEAGLWERNHLLKPISQIADTTAEMAETVKMAKTAAIVVAAGGVGLAAYSLYWFFDAVYGIGENITSASKDAYRAGTAPGAVNPPVQIVKSILRSVGIF